MNEEILIEPCYLVGEKQSPDCLKTIFGNARINDEGYYKITSKKEGNNGKFLHRLIVQKFYQIKLPSDWVVHHKNENKLDCRIINLHIMPKSKHDRLHKHSDKTKLRLSKSQNSTGFYRVKKHKDNSCKQGFIWRYTYYENSKRKEIESVSLTKLQEKVTEKGLLWCEI